jgi:hypothetical protein
MKRLLTLIFILLLAGIAFADTTTISWTPSVDTDTEGYRVAQGKKGGPYTVVATALGAAANTTSVTYNRSNGRCFVVIAFAGVEIAPNSGEVCLQLAPATNVRIP